MWPHLLLNFSIAFIFSYIYLLLLYSSVSLQCFLLLSSLNSYLCLRLLSSPFFFLLRLMMIFLDNRFCLDQRIFWSTNIYKNVPNFLFFGHKNVSDFLEIYLKLFFFLVPFFFQNFGASFHLEALGNGLFGLVAGSARIQL